MSMPPMLSMTGTFLSNQILPIKGKWEALRQRRLNISDLSVTRENDPNVARETPVSEVDEDMQMLNTDNNKLSSTTPTNNKAPPAWTEGQQQVQEDDCSKNAGKYNRSMLPGGYSVVEPPSTSAVSCAPCSAVDDEMLSWLQYPMDENFEKSYCSELFGDVPSSSMQTYSSNNTNNTSNNSNSNGNTRRTLVVTSTNSTTVVNVQKPPNAEAAMALGAERAAGLSSQVGHEAFCRVKTSVQPPVPKWPSTMAPAPSTTDIVSELHQHSKSIANFPMYSVPVTTAPSNFVVLQGPVHHANSKAEKSRSLIAESVAAAPPQRHESVESPHVKKEQLGSFISAGGSSKTKSIENDEIHRKSAGHKRYEPEATITSSSGGSENTTEKSEKAERVVEKRKAKQISESTECQSEDVEGESVDTKKPLRPKRSRAAEVHNLSERRRRDRINEKMRALQELIPNSNKTDKASMLDEAIEYLKMLQLQLQMMSMRSGMTLPPMVMPSGVQAMQMPHITALAPYGAGMVGGCINMNMGMGMGMGMGMNMVDMSGNSSVRPLHLQTIQHSEPQQHQHQQLLGDSYNVYVSQPQMQVPVQVVNRDTYSSYMLPMAPPGPQQTSNQQQQQQTQPQQQHQHQQQLHPGHHGLNQ